MHPLISLAGGRYRQAPLSALAVLRVATATGSIALLAACQTLTPDAGVGPVAKFVNDELGKKVVAIRNDEDAEDARNAIRRLLRRPLTADAAVQVALLNNRGLQAVYNELGTAEAVMVRASLPPSPSFSISSFTGGGELEIERKIIGNILALATLPARAEIASQRFQQAQLRAIAGTLRVAIDARRAFYGAVAESELVLFLAQAQTAAQTAAQLGKRLGESGALNKLDQAREQVFYADVTTQLASARQRADAARERLIRALGLWGRDVDVRLVRTLPALPARPRALPAIETEAVRRRVDLQIARIEVETLAKSYGLTEATRFINLLDVAGQSKTVRKADGEIERQHGVEVEFQIPIFDFGQTRVREAEQTYMAAVNRLVEKAVNARSDARGAYRKYRASYDIAAHYRREVLPLRKIISDETLLRYNAMQIDVFALLAEARQRVGANIAAIQAQRDFWFANTDLFAVVVGGGSGAGTSEPMQTATITTGESAGH